MEVKEKKDEKREYITIAEFAERAGVSKQAVYQRLNKGLKEYSRVVDGVKMLDLRALEELYGKELGQGIEQEIDKDSKANGQENQDVIKALLEQLNVKDQQIADLNARLADEQRNHGRTQLLLIEREHQLQMIEDQRKEQEERKSQEEGEQAKGDPMGKEPGKQEEEMIDLFCDEDYPPRKDENPRKWWQFWK